MKLPIPSLKIATGCLLAAAMVTVAHSAATLTAGGANGNSPNPGGYDDHQNMMDQLGITQLRPGKSGSNQTGPGFELAKANPWKDSMPDALTMKDGTRVTSAAQWPARRAEILEDFEREVYGRVPKNMPKVTWTVTRTVNGLVGGIPAVGKQLVGHVDNSSYPALDVNISMILVTPANATGPVPVLMMFGGGGLPQPAIPPGPSADDIAQLNRALKALLVEADPELQQVFERHAAYNPFSVPPTPSAGGGGGSTGQQLLADGWGYASIDTASIQADTGAGMALRQGIIGLVNKGQPRSPEDWGALRAWAWGAARGLDYLETDPAVDAKHVGIEGVSRNGKAALVTLAFEPRFAMALIGSSGEGGVKLHRHDFGEAVENLTGGEYYWMAGNFIKYGAAAPFVKTAADIPVDSHELLALCAPRLAFVSYGVETAPGLADPKWVDAPGSFMAAVLATPVYRLLGKNGLDTPGNYLTDPMPPVGTLLGGELAWRQHEGGHTDGPNVPYFISWADKYIGRKSPSK